MSRPCLFNLSNIFLKSNSILSHYRSLTCMELYVECIRLGVVLCGRENHLQRIGESCERMWSFDTTNIIHVNKAILLNSQIAATVTGISNKCEIYCNNL